MLHSLDLMKKLDVRSTAERESGLEAVHLIGSQGAELLDCSVE